MSESLEYFGVMTAVGRQKANLAFVAGSTVSITTFVVGDGEDAITANTTEFPNEKYRGVLTDGSVLSNGAAMQVETYVPSDADGFIIRQMGLIDSDGDLVVVAEVPNIPKPQITSGAAVDLRSRIIFVTENAESIQIVIDPTIANASREYVDLKVNNLRGEVEVLLAEHLASINASNISRIWKA